MSNIEKLFKEHKVIVLPKDTRITEDVIMRLDSLLEFAPPEELKDNLIEIYHTYIIHANDALPPDFEKFSSNLYFRASALEDDTFLNGDYFNGQ